jgi:hypothetical protein
VPAGITRLVLFAGKFVAKFTVAGDEIESRLPPRFGGRLPAGITRLWLLAGNFAPEFCVPEFTVAGDENDSRLPPPKLPVTSTRIKFVEPTTGVFVQATHEIVFELVGFAKRRLFATHVPPICGACTG